MYVEISLFMAAEMHGTCCLPSAMVAVITVPVTKDRGRQVYIDRELSFEWPIINR
jgi:hypothetical protein